MVRCEISCLSGVEAAGIDGDATAQRLRKTWPGSVGGVQERIVSTHGVPIVEHGSSYCAMVPVHGPRVTVVQQRRRCGSMKVDPAVIQPEATPEGASVSSDEWH
jgi:hypothetical protein